MSLSERDKKVIWHPYTQMQLAPEAIGIVRAEGAYLYDESGRRYLDMVSSWWVNLHGHSHPYIAEKLSEQAKKLEHVIFAGFTHEPAVELAERLLDILPQHQKRVFYSDNGSTAVEVAIKMAFQYWHNKGIKKQKIIALGNSYHGDTFGAMAVSGRSVFTEAFADLLFDVHFIQAPYPGKEEQSLKEVKNFLTGNNDVAAFIYEPLVQGTGGMLMYEPEALDALLREARSKGVFAIADEVMTGFGRTGKLFASHYLQEQPDMVCLSKGLTGGTMPLGVTTCTEEVYNAFLSSDKTKALFHGHSYTANPLACTVGLASLDLLLSDECQQAIQNISKTHSEFSEKISKHPAVDTVRHKGAIFALDIKTGDERSYFNKIGSTFYQYFLERGILLRPLGNTLYIFPPYCTSLEELGYVYQTVEEYLNQYAQ